MKRLILLILIVFPALTGFSQEKNKGYFTISGGLSQPVGDFGDTSMDNEKAGHAGIGFNFSIAYAYPVTKHLHLGAIYGLRRNAPDLEAANEAAHKAGQGRPYYSPDFYRGNYFLLEAIYQLPVSEEVSFLGKVGGGVSFNMMPRIYRDKNSAANSAVHPRVTSEGLAYGLGAGVRYQPNTVGLGLETTYINTNPAFEGNNITANLPLNSLNYNLMLFFLL